MNADKSVKITCEEKLVVVDVIANSRLTFFPKYEFI